MTGVWKDSDYGSGATISLAGFIGSISYSMVRGEGFIGRFERWTLKERFKSSTEAKVAVEKFANKKCQQLVDALKG